MYKDAKFYKSDYWRNVRSQVFRRDNYTCQECGYVGEVKTSYGPDKRALVAHHIVDRHNGGSDRLNNLQTLCMSCHNKKPGKH